MKSAFSGTLSRFASSGPFSSPSIGTMSMATALLLAACGRPVAKAPETSLESPPASETKRVEPPAENPPPKEELLPTAEELQLERERTTALAAFRKTQGANHLGVQSVLIARTSDVPWLLAFRNNSSESVDVFADPGLLEFEVRSGDEPEPAPVLAKKGAKSSVKKAAAKQVCRKGEPLTKANASQYVTLAPGALLTYSFDPRPLCGAEIPLLKGKKIVPAYGFPISSKKVWKSGKSTEVTNETEAPFVARRTVAAAESPVPLKALALDAFVLDEPYPLDSVSPLEDETSSESEAARAAAEAMPLKLAVKPLGTVNDADETVVNISLSNRGKESIVLFFRREHIVYEIQGPLGPTSCRMSPSDRAPEANSYDTLSSGETTSLATRLAEACPLGTFDTPGIYNVSARLEARQSGKEVSLEAFVGDVTTTAPAKLNVKGTKKVARLTPVMRVIAPAAPATESSMAAPRDASEPSAAESAPTEGGVAPESN